MNNKNNFTKIDDKYENPIDVIAYDLCKYIEHFFKLINATPNNITTISLLFGLLCVYFMILSKKKTKRVYKIYAFIFYWLSFLFDCLDGYYARKYKMYSKLGDKYDHYSDLVKHLLIYYVLMTRLNKKFIIIFNILLITIFVGLIIQTGCQEKKYSEKIGEKESKNNSSYLRMFIPLCKDPELILKYSKYFGVGTITLLFSIFILLI
jgi:phosphatidylglycerophosphate synthase